MKIIAFGEILWDVFGSEKTLGGAPFNFAAHSAKLGAESYLVSCVGNDENGKNALEYAAKIGIKTDYIALDRNHKTGECNVSLENGIPKYELVQNTAYDHIPICSVSGKFDAIYMGTLAMRSQQSRRSFERLISSVESKEVLFDVNFRSNFYSRELVNALLRNTTILKVSDEEIDFFGKRNHIDIVLELSKKHPNLKFICVTLGKDGAMVFDCRKKQILFSEKPKNKVVSTVGAGDSFAAAFLTGILSGLKPAQALDRAIILSDFVVGHLAAVPQYEINELFKNIL